ncbi:carbohydrate-binding module family 12 protein [Amylocystis lapponica]|nr:carbohydrate-binding module family 12 protein [Amylocystis lapponica]
MPEIYEWEPGTFYAAESVVVYQSAKYKIIQPHQSEPGWEPPATPALWGRLPEDYGGYQQPQQSFGGGGNNSGYNPGYVQPGAPQVDQPPPPVAQGDYGNEKNWDQHDTQQVDIHHEERKKNWYDLTDERKKQLEIGGGLAAGLAVIGGGYLAYQHHNKNEDEKKANVWALQNWLHEAEARTQDFFANGPRGPATWILNEGNSVPQGAIPGGEQQGRTLYICRGFHEGGIQVGKVIPDYEKGAVIGYAHKEIHLPKYEILVGDERALRWVDVRGSAKPEHLQARPVEGGREADGTPLFVAKAHHHNSIVPGKASPKLGGAFIPYSSTEVKVEEYRVLCYA